jgi:hypothetical protein
MYESKKVVNVILNSNNALAGSTTNNANYSIDWSYILKEGTAYRMHWTYVGMPNTLTIASKLAQVQINFNMEQYLNTSSTIGAPVTLTIGVLRSAYLNGSINTLYAGDNDNTPIYLPYRPYNNTFNVKILTNDATPVLWTDNKTLPGPVNDFQPPGAYILTLCFTEVE